MVLKLLISQKMIDVKGKIGCLYYVEKVKKLLTQLNKIVEEKVIHIKNKNNKINYVDNFILLKKMIDKTIKIIYHR